MLDVKMKKHLVIMCAAMGVAWTAGAETVRARYVLLTVTASRPAPAQPPFCDGRCCRLCD